MRKKLNADQSGRKGWRIGNLCSAIRAEGPPRPGPKAVQRIYPPLQNAPLKTWVAVGASPNSVLRAARYDLPMMLGIIVGEAERFRPFVELYRQAFAKLGRPVR